MVEQHEEQRAVQPVHLVVVGLELGSRSEVAVGDDRTGLPRHPLGRLSHRGDGRTELRHDRDLRVAHPRHLGDVHRQIPHPLDLCGDAQRRDDSAQVAGDGSLAGHEFEQALVEVGTQCVDLCVAGDDPIGEGDVGLQQRPGCGADRRPHHRRHDNEPVGDRVQLLVVALPHAAAPPL